MDNTDLWLREKQLERYAQEIKAYCESQNGDCRGCYFCIMNPQKPQNPWGCKFNGDTPEEWEVE